MCLRITPYRQGHPNDRNASITTALSVLLWVSSNAVCFSSSCKFLSFSSRLTVFYYILLLTEFCFLHHFLFLFHRNHLLWHHIEIPHDSLKYSLSFCKIFSEEFPLIHSQRRKTRSGPMWLTEMVCVFLTTSFLGVRALTL